MIYTTCEDLLGTIHSIARRDSPYSYEPVSNINDVGENDDAEIQRYFSDYMKTRDVNGQAAADEATFNGKLIPCFIHRWFLLLQAIQHTPFMFN